MKIHSIYNLTTGQIVKTINCDDDQLGVNVLAGQGSLEGDAAVPSYVAGGVFVPIPTSPSTFHVWDWGSRQWADPRSLARRKIDKWVEIKAAAALADSANITLLNREFEADDESRAALYRKLQTALMDVADGLPFSVDWTLANNTEVTLAANQLKAVVRAIDARTEQIRAAARTLRQAIAAATTPQAVDAITWA